MLCLPLAGKNNKGMRKINWVRFLVSEQNRTIKQNLCYSELNKPSKTNVHFHVGEHNGTENGNCPPCVLLLSPLPKSSLLHLHPVIPKTFWVFVVVVFQHRIFLCSSGCLRSNLVDQAWFKLAEIHLPLHPKCWY